MGKTKQRGVAFVPLVPVRRGVHSLEVPGEGACHRQALRLLRERGLAPSSIVSVSPYAVTYLDRCRNVRTAWTVVEAAGTATRLKVWAEPGLPAFPTE